MQQYNNSKYKNTIRRSIHPIHIIQKMSLAAASAENTMNILKVQVNQSNKENDNNSVDPVDCACSDDKNNNKELKEEDKIFFKSTLNDSDDDMFVIILEEKVETVETVENNEVKSEIDLDSDKKNEIDDDGDGEGVSGGDGDDANLDVTPPMTTTKQEKILTPKQKYIGIEVYTHLQQTLESQKMYPLLPCNMISSFARVMEFVEYFDIPSEERKKLVIDLVKILAYSNNDYGSRDCFDYFVEHNMIDDIIKTIVDSTKNRYDINRFPHTNRKIVLSCVSLSNKIKIVKPSAKIESIFEEFKLNLCGLKRFFKMKEKDESKQT